MSQDTRPDPIVQKRRITSAEVDEANGILYLKLAGGELPKTVAIPLVNEQLTLHLLDLDRSASMVVKLLPTLE